MENLYKLFKNTLEATYIHVDETSADYYTEVKDRCLYIYLESSNGIVDWKNNLDFPAIPYKRMGRTVWFAHRGFLRVWKSIEPRILEQIKSREINRIIISGYSHGGALACLCHEYAWYNRPDIRDEIHSFGFGAPRVLWGFASYNVRQRWKNYTIIRNMNDMITHLPPKAIGYFHVGKMLIIGNAGIYSMIDAHRPENILSELKKTSLVKE